MNYDDLLKICDMYLGLPDPIEDDLDAESCLIRLGTQQFDYQRQKITLLPRTLLMYKQLWAKEFST
ncbi:MAG: hypothetical protein HC887_04315 [Desulfobacteraceae bacterium]|nr:hypothetical protein [Desulfobacteraceae bacterium]